MKFFLAFLVLGLFAIAHSQDAALTPEDILEIIKEANPTVTCINWECRTNCQAEGNKAGYCKLGSCVCVPLPAA